MQSSAIRSNPWLGVFRLSKGEPLSLGELQSGSVEKATKIPSNSRCTSYERSRKGIILIGLILAASNLAVW